MGHGKHHSPKRLSCIGTNVDIRRLFHGTHAPTQDTCNLHPVLSTTEPIAWVLMQTMMLRQMNMFASNQALTALTLSLMTKKKD
jgi:hypothetical protein